MTANNVEGVDLRVGQCADGSAVAVYELPDMGHAWPGGSGSGSGSMGYSSSPINATEQIWAFFRVSFAGGGGILRRA